MKREELISSPVYWTVEIQMELFRMLKEYMEKENLNQTELAEKLGFTKGYISQILNGNFDHRISKFVELAIAVGKVPRIVFDDLEEVLEKDKSKKSKVEKLIVTKAKNSSKLTKSKSRKLVKKV